MFWDRFLYGSEDISPHKRLFVKVLLLVSLLSVYGIWTDFIPSELWLYYGFIISICFTIIIVLYVLWKKMSEPMKQCIEIDDWKKTISYIAMPFILFGFTWIGLVHGLADIVTLNIGVPHTSSAELKKEYSPGRRQCHYLLEGPFLDRAFPSYICISKSEFNSLPETSVFIIEGKISFFGFHISHVKKE